MLLYQNVCILYETITVNDEHMKKCCPTTIVTINNIQHTLIVTINNIQHTLIVTTKNIQHTLIVTTKNIQHTLTCIIVHTN